MRIDTNNARALCSFCVPYSRYANWSAPLPRFNSKSSRFSVGISGDHGSDPVAVDVYVDGLSNDEEWTNQQKERLANCSSMILNQVPAENEDTYMLACWHQLLMSDCNRKAMTILAEAVDPENAKQLVEALADLAEGPCFDIGLKYVGELGSKWATCAAKNKLEMNTLSAAAHHYTLFSRGESIPEITLENNAEALEQLDRLNATRLCYAVSTGEVGEDGAVNYELINEATRNAIGREEFMVVDKAFVEYCRYQNPASIGEFYACYSREKPLACAVLKSYDIALGRQATNAASVLEASAVGPTVASFLTGLLSSIF